jgi:ATP-dependent Zn protease
MSKFDMIIGYGAVKKELKQIADTLKNREYYEKLGVSAPRGLLLHGEPGVGKMRDLVINRGICGLHLYSYGYRDANSQNLWTEQEKATAKEIEKIYRKVKEILSLNAEFLEKLADALSRKKLLSAADVQKIKSECKIVPVAL